jgi:hypothetical protein
MEAEQYALAMDCSLGAGISTCCDSEESVTVSAADPNELPDTPTASITSGSSESPVANYFE